MTLDLLLSQHTRTTPEYTTGPEKGRRHKFEGGGGFNAFEGYVSIQ